MKHRSSLPALVAVAVLALVLGSLGTAVAAPTITKATVKKLAAKVVKKEAPGLAVASAATATTATTASTATNATNLGGKAPAAYQNNVTVYTSAVTVAANANTFPLTLAPGDYVLSYSAFFPAAPQADCYFYRVRAAVTVFYGEDTSSSATYGSAMSGTALINIATGDTVVFRCLRSAASTTPSDEPIQILATKVDAVTQGGFITPAARPAGRGGR